MVPKVDIQAVYIYDMKQATYQFTSRPSEEFDASSNYAHNNHVCHCQSTNLKTRDIDRMADFVQNLDNSYGAIRTGKGTLKLMILPLNHTIS